jgi:hypothetical protein
MINASYQCAMPVFEGLFPEPDNEHILDLLYIFATWHALAKLRVHIDDTLQLLDIATSAIGAQLRDFRDTICVKYDTHELSKEMLARRRRNSQKIRIGETTTEIQEGGNAHMSSSSLRTNNTRNHSETRKQRKFNLNTYKFHAMGDYVESIKRFGTTDSYSTETVSRFIIPSYKGQTLMQIQSELEHRTVKARYRRTSKKDHIQQLTQIERRQARVHNIRRRLKGPGESSVSQKDSKNDNTAGELLSSLPDSSQYVIGNNQNSLIDIFDFCRRHVHDPAAAVSDR